MARYLVLLIAAALVASTYFSSNVVASARSAASAYPETRSAHVEVSAWRNPGLYVAPAAADQALASFAHRIRLVDGERTRVRDFDLLYHAPSLAASAPDRLLIMAKGEVYSEEAIPAQFTGTLAQRTLDVAQFDVKGRHYLLVTAGGAPEQPRWFAIFDDGGQLLYRAATEHGGYRFAQLADGLSMVDDAGYGKRFSVL